MNRLLVLVTCLGLATLALVAVGPAAADEVTVDVTVVDQDGEPINERVTLLVEWDGGSEEIETSSSGVAVFDVPEGEDIEFSIEHDDYVRNVPLIVEDATTPAGESRLAIDLDVSLAGTADITVEDNGSPVEGVELTATDPQEDRFEKTVETDESGQASLDRLEQRNYTVTTSKEGYFDTEQTVSIDETSVSETFSIETGEVRVDFLVQDDHFETPEPVADATVEIIGDSTLTTRSDGTRGIDLAVNTDYDVEISKEGYDSVSETVSVGEEDVQFNLSIQRTPELTLTSLADKIIAGQSTVVTVTNVYDEPVPNATVGVDGEAQTETDADGTAVVTLDTAGERNITASIDGLETSLPVQVYDADDLDEDDTDETDDVDAADDADDADDTDDADDDGPGFGPLLAVGSLLVATTLMLYRRRSH